MQLHFFVSVLGAQSVEKRWRIIMDLYTHHVLSNTFFNSCWLGHSPSFSSSILSFRLKSIVIGRLKRRKSFHRIIFIDDSGFRFIEKLFMSSNRFNSYVAHEMFLLMELTFSTNEQLSKEAKSQNRLMTNERSDFFGSLFTNETATMETNAKYI